MSPQDQFAADVLATRLMFGPLSLRRATTHFRDCHVMHPEGWTGVTIHRRVFNDGEEQFQVSLHDDPWQTWEMRQGPYGPASFPVSKWASRMEALSVVVEKLDLRNGPRRKPTPPKAAKPKPKDYHEAALRLGNRETLSVQNNTKLVRLDADTIALRLHRTNVVEWSRDGTIVLYTGGWFTSTTAERINDYTPVWLRVDGKKDTRRTKNPADSWTCFDTRKGVGLNRRELDFGRSDRVRCGPRGALGII